MAQQGTQDSEYKVLVGLDPSELSERAFRWYLNTFHDPRKHKLHVITVPEDWAAVAGMMSPARREELVKETNASTQRLEQLCDEICREKGVQGTFKVLRGQEVWHAICQYAKEINASTIVLGTRGQGVIRRTVLGSVSEGVLHHCHVPVIIYKE